MSSLRPDWARLLQFVSGTHESPKEPLLPDIELAYRHSKES